MVLEDDNGKEYKLSIFDEILGQRVVCSNIQKYWHFVICRLALTGIYKSRSRVQRMEVSDVEPSSSSAIVHGVVVGELLPIKASKKTAR